MSLILNSKYFTVADVTRSQIAAREGIINEPSPDLYSNINYTASQLDILRDFLQKPVFTSSWYRCLELNRKLKSLDTSAHIKGLAGDIESPQFGTPLEICKYVLANPNNIQYDQMILEHTWVHFGFNSPNSPNAKPRFQVLTLLDNGKYVLGLTTKQGILL